MYFRLFLIFLFFLINADVFSQEKVVLPIQKELQEFRQEIDSILVENNIPGLALGVAKKGDILWLEAFGYADRENNIKANIHHAFPIGSTAKSFAATGLMTFISDGKIKLTDSINPIINPVKLKDINGNTPDIKVWQVMSMTAGIPQGYRSFSKKSMAPLSGKSERDFYEKTAIVAFKPGEVYHYSNLSMGVVQYVTEQLANNSDYQSVMEKKLFKPLGLDHTFVGYDESQDEQLVRMYDSRGERIDNTYYATPESGLGFWTSANDLLKYGMFHAGSIKKPHIIDVINLNLMHSFRDGPGDMFGLGWFNFGDENNEIVSNGNVTGGNAMIYINKSEELVIVAMVNRTSWDNQANKVVDRIKDIFIEPTAGDGYLQWKRIYNPKYNPRYSLLGKWKGKIKSPETGESILATLDFQENGEVLLKVYDQEVVIEDKSYNLLQNFTGTIQAVLPITTNHEKNSYDVILHHKEDVLQGYLENNVFGEDYSFRLPLYMKFIKISQDSL